MKNSNNKKQNHTSHFAHHTSQRGITLIALIITIIVMLILVGVTINVALNGGLFEKAEDAAEQTQMASEKEQLMMAALGVFDVNTGVDFDNIDLPEGFKPVSSDNVKAVYEGPSGKQYEVTKESGKVNEKGESDEEEPDDVTSTIWEARGVTSTNVKYNRIFHTDEYGENGVTFGLYSNGDLCFDLTGETITVDNESANNNVGSGGAESEALEQYIPAGYLKCFENGITLAMGLENPYWLTFRYGGNNTVSLYGGETSVLDENGHIPESETYFLGTLLPQ